MHLIPKVLFRFTFVFSSGFVASKISDEGNDFDFDVLAVEGVPRIYGPLYKPISFYLYFRRKTIHANLSQGAISAINRTVFKPLPLPSTFSQTIRRRCFCCVSSVLQVVMSLRISDDVQVLYVFILIFCVSNS